MEEINKLVTGCFVVREELNKNPDDEEDSEGEDDADMAWQSYKDVSDISMGKSFVKYDKPKCLKGDLINLDTGRLQKVRGIFHFPFTWWQVTILRTKMTKDKHIEAKDAYALCYRLRDDPKRFADNIIHMFISRIQSLLKDLTSFVQTRSKFEGYLEERDQYANLDFVNLEERINSFCDSFPEDEQNGIISQFKTIILDSFDFNYVRLGQTHPELLHFIPQLFPFHCKMILSLSSNKLRSLSKALDEEPGILAFKPILARRCNILGCETSSEALIKSGKMSKVPQEVHDAILIYEYLKKETKENGHTYIHYNKILDLLGQVVSQFEEALDYLNKNKVTKTQMESGYRVVYLMSLWKAENKIARGLSSLWEMNEKQAWKLEVDFDRDDFETIRGDTDQFRAAKLIADQPVVAISGKGGCGKTYVVTKVITSAKCNRSGNGSTLSETSKDKSADCTGNHSNNLGDATDADIGVDEETQQPLEESVDMFDTSAAMEGEDEEKCPEKINLLLTAPTGKAANLLGKRARSPSYTLHQVIFSYRMLEEDKEWKHKDVNILVVDECSLVSVTTYAFLIELLLDHAQLRRVILLGDIRQLPSIEPGNFLEDTFKSLTRIGCGIELTNNHRAESNDIINNATRISKKMYPVFNDEKFMLRKLPENNPGTTGDDFLSQDINVAVMKLLDHEALKDDINSQFISFTRKVCESINDLCCKRYSNHRIKENNKYVFRTNDKICCTKNGYVNVYEEAHGFMTCFKQKKTSSNTTEDGESGGGVDRTINTDGEQQDINTTALVPGTHNDSGSHVDGHEGSQNAPPKPNQIRLCNGEIFFIMDEVEKLDDSQRYYQTFYLLSDKDPDMELQFWVERRNIRKACKIIHAWARTIHTFQGSETDHVVYILGRSKHQNWQHVYTAVTRGRKTVFIVGQESILRQAIRRSEIKRQTSLRKQLVEKFQKYKAFSLTQGNQTFGNSSTFISTQTNCSIMPPVIRPVNNKPHPFMQKQAHSLVTINEGDIILNNTQFDTAILTSLASEHDDDIKDTGQSGSSPFTKIKTVTPVEDNQQTDTEMASESDDEESQSLLSSPTRKDIRTGVQKLPANEVKKGLSNRLSLNKNNHTARKRYSEIKMKQVEDVVDDKRESDKDSGAESDDSQSLLSPLSASNRYSQIGKVPQTSKTGDVLRYSKESTSSIIIENTNSVTNNTELYTSKLKNNCSKLRNTPKQENVNLLMSKSITTHLKNNTGSVQHGMSPITPANTKFSKLLTEGSKQFGKSPVTPGFGNGFTPVGESVRNTSSPVTTDSSFSETAFYIRTGLSPLTPGYNESFTSQFYNIKNNNSNSPFNSSYARDKAPASPKFTESVCETTTNTSNTADIKEPKNNESQWSEIDDSEYLNIDDSALIQKNSEHKEQKTEFHKSAIQPMFTALRERQARLSSSLSKQVLNRSLCKTNISTDSQWSELDDEHYMTLDLEDLMNMEETDSDRGNGTHAGNNNQRNSSVSFKPDQGYRNNQLIKMPGNIVPDTPPVPHVPETPSRSRSPEIKRKTSESDQVTPPKRIYKPEEASIESPLRRSLAKLDFQ